VKALCAAGGVTGELLRRLIERRNPERRHPCVRGDS
jgi:hypothetical protein